MAQQRRRGSFLIATAVFLGVLLTCFFIIQASYPRFVEARYRTSGRFVGDAQRSVYYDGKSTWKPSPANAPFTFVTPLIPQAQREWGNFQLPLYAYSGGDDVDVEFTVHLQALHPWMYRVVADDCLRELTINGKVVEGRNNAPLQFCNLEGQVLDLSAYLTGGANTVQARIRDNGGFAIFRMDVAGADPFFLATRIIAFGALAGYLWFLMFSILRFKKALQPVVLAVVFCAGLALIYNIRFAYSHFSYDADGHVNYIVFLREMWAIPPPEGYGAEGWQFYQPPLYYFFVALWWVIGGGVFGRSQWWLIQDTETISWAIMAMTLGVVAWLSSMLFRSEKEKGLAALQVLLFGVIPGVVFMSSRITNDVALFFFSSLFLAFLYRWWQNPQSRTWVLLWLIAAAALLSKSNGMALVPIALIALLFRRRISLLAKAGLGGFGVLLVAVSIGWYAFLRAVVHGQNVLVGNLGALHIGLHFDAHWWQLLVFNPIALFFHPFNNPWSDEFRRQYYWEYLYRSAFFGEWDFGHKATVMAALLLIAGTPLVVAGVYGIYRCVRKDWYAQVPLLATMLVFFAEGIAYRTVAPYGCNQDFRFIAPVIIPCTYYAIMGITQAPKRLQQPLWQAFTVFVVSCSAFILGIVAFFGT